MFGWFFMLLGLLFVGLKLGGVIAWSWFFVLLPFLLWIGIVAGILVFMTFIAVVAATLGIDLNKRVR